MATNEPTGFTELTARSFEAKEENDWLDRGDTAFTIETVNGPEGDNTVGQAFFEEGFEAGSGPIKTYYPISGRTDQAFFLYLRGFRVDEGWFGQSASVNKIFFIAHAEGPGIFVQVAGSGDGQLFFRVNTQMPSAVQTRDYSFGQSGAGGQDYECVRGTFYDIQVLCEENEVGSEDTGRIRLWVKESAQSEGSWVLVADSDVEVPTYDSGEFDGLIFWDDGEDHYFNGEHSWNPTWGGAGGTVPDDQYQQIDYAYISVGALGATIQPAPRLSAFWRNTAIGFTCQVDMPEPGSPGGVIAFVHFPLANASAPSSVTYGGRAMTLIGSGVGKSTGEAMSIYAYLLGDHVPPGIQSLLVTVASPAVIVAHCCTITTTPGFGITAADSVTFNGDSVSNPSDTLSLGGENAFCVLSMVSGQNATSSIAPLTGWTSRNEAAVGDPATCTVACYTYDTTDSDDVTAGWTQTSEDAVGIAVALAEEQLVASGGGIVLLSRRRQRRK